MIFWVFFTEVIRFRMSLRLDMPHDLFNSGLEAFCEFSDASLKASDDVIIELPDLFQRGKNTRVLGKEEVDQLTLVASEAAHGQLISVPLAPCVDDQNLLLTGIGLY